MIVVYVVVQFHPWFKLDFPLFLCIAVYDEYKTKENKHWTKDKTEPHVKHKNSQDFKVTLFIHGNCGHNFKSHELHTILPLCKRRMLQESLVTVVSKTCTI